MLGLQDASPGELATMDAAAIALRARRISVVELVSDTLDRIARLDPALHAFNTVDRDGALAAAKVLDQELARSKPRSPLHGLPVAIKDTVDVQGLPTTGSSHALDWTPARHDAAVVIRLRAAGAVIIGKANTWELGCGTGEIQTATAFPEACNPVRAGCFAGGSSSGSAAAVAAGLSYAAIGGDTGGSIRSPASACGIVGLKPTFGRVPVDGFLAHSATLDHAGPMARTVRDVAAVFAAIAEPISEDRARPLDGLRIGVPAEMTPPRVALDADVAQMFGTTLDRIRAAGARIVTVATGPDIELWRETLGTIAGYESARANAALLRRTDRLSPTVRDWLTSSNAITLTEYGAAREARVSLIHSLDSAMATVDALVMPSSFRTVPHSKDETARLAYSLASPNAVFNMSGYPAISIPNGRDRNGLPTGLQIAMPKGADVALLHLAEAIERSLAD
jgi:aspartyl-tRNA(Asn)/glutamyl-tRNA(Gln) amidotransferase subunit A